MLINFDQLPELSKVWIYQSERKLSETEMSLLCQRLIIFIDQWTSHGADVQGSFKVYYGQFVVIGSYVPNDQVSGCSIDKSVHFFQEMGQELGLNMMDRKVAFIKDNDVNTIELQKVRSLVESGEINEDTLVFNHAITQKSELETQWLVPAIQTWTKKYFLKFA